MSRLLLLLVMIAWFAAEADPPPALGFSPISRQILIFGVFGLIVLIPALWSRIASRHVAIGNLARSLRRYGWATSAARILIPVWFAVCVFGLGWVQIVYASLGRIGKWPVALPAAFLGTMPALVSWAALWWASYPADRAIREQSLLLHLQDDLPIHAPPSFWTYFIANVRMQLLFTVAPIAVILFVRDIITLVMTWGFHLKLGGNHAVADRTPTQFDLASAIEWLVLPAAGLFVFLIAPEILRRVLQTQPLPPGDLRDRLEAICRRVKLRYRDILLWRTGNNMGNAAVMGLIPRVRYILLSDLLLQTMTDQQIEAVFAHEAGHVVHRHIAWYGVFVIIVMVAEVMLANLAAMLHIDLRFIPEAARDPLALAVAIGLFFLLFGLLSRCFERQADVFAARTMERELSLAPAADTLQTPAVGIAGAALFASALHRVAVVNNIPLRARNFSHGSIAQRMDYIQDLGANPENTTRFDRFMSNVKWLLLGAFVLSIAATIYALL